uniref:Ig-like domain-containing protein n=1 Tax=Ditylenchus dipsaci TaxID=166011 RepID=A0A915ESR8_9BILA
MATLRALAAQKPAFGLSACMPVGLLTGNGLDLVGDSSKSLTKPSTQDETSGSVTTEDAGLSLVQELQNLEVAEGSKAEFSAQLSEVLPRSGVQVKWWKDGQELNTRTSFKHKAKQDGKLIKLVISNVQAVDVGVYKFVVEWSTAARKPSGPSVASNEASLKLAVKGRSSISTSKVEQSNKAPKTSSTPDPATAPQKNSTKTTSHSSGEHQGLAREELQDPASPTNTGVKSSLKEDSLVIEVDENSNHIPNTKSLQELQKPSSQQQFVSLESTQEDYSYQLTSSKPQHPQPSKNVPPAIRMPLPAMRELPEEERGVALVCALTGIPSPKISWLKDDMPIDDTNAQFTYENGVATMTMLDKAKRSDSGVYACVATNAHGSVRSSGVLYIHPRENQKQCAPQFQQPLVGKTIPLGSELILQCELFNGRPMADVEWSKDGLKLLKSTRHISFHDSQGLARLTIMKVAHDDAGEYSCQAVNIHGKDFTHCRVQVLADPIVEADKEIKKRKKNLDEENQQVGKKDSKTETPVISRQLKAVKVHEGNRVLLECEVQSLVSPSKAESQQADPQVEWYHNGQLVASSRTLRTYFDGRLALLKIYDVQLCHQGDYECRVWNPAGSASSTANVCVEAVQPRSTSPTQDFSSNMPSFIQKLQDIHNAEEGSAVTMKVQVTGSPMPEIQWLHNGKAISSKDGVQMSNNGAEFQLIISKLSTEHAGTYTAVAKNLYGDAHTSALIYLKEKVEEATKKKLKRVKESIKQDEQMTDQPKLGFRTPLMDKTVILGETAQLQCTLDGWLDTLPSIEWMKDGKRLVAAKRVTTKFDEQKAVISLRIANCQSGDAGTYKCTVSVSGNLEQSTECFLTIATRTGSDKHLVAAASMDEQDEREQTQLLSSQLVTSSGPPRFTKCLRDVLVPAVGTLTEPLRFEVEMDGTPLPRVMWLHNNKPVVESASTTAALSVGGVEKNAKKSEESEKDGQEEKVEEEDMRSHTRHRQSKHKHKQNKELPPIL